MTKTAITRETAIQRVILIEGTANTIILIAKGIVGLSTGSLALLADAVHSLTDTFNNIVAWVVMRHAGLPADEEHPYGHNKFETVAVFGLAALLAALALELSLQALLREPAPIVTHPWALIVMLAVLVANIALAAWQRSRARALNSDILLADASHTFADVLTTVVVIVGWQLSAAGYPWLDRLCTLAVAALVFYLAFTLFRRAIPILVDQSSIDPTSLAEAIERIEGVSSVVRVRSRWIGADRAVDMIVTMPGNLSNHESHQIADMIELELESQFGVTDTSIHVEPDMSTMVEHDAPSP